LEITLDREIIDAVFEGTDDEFIVMVDGNEPSFSEINTTSQSRTLKIYLPLGSEEIEIIGSKIGQQSGETAVEDTKCGPGTIPNEAGTSCVLG